MSQTLTRGDALPLPQFSMFPLVNKSFSFERYIICSDIVHKKSDMYSTFLLFRFYYICTEIHRNVNMDCHDRIHAATGRYWRKVRMFYYCVIARCVKVFWCMLSEDRQTNGGRISYVRHWATIYERVYIHCVYSTGDHNKYDVNMSRKTSYTKRFLCVQ